VQGIKRRDISTIDVYSILFLFFIFYTLLETQPPPADVCLRYIAQACSDGFRGSGVPGPSPRLGVVIVNTRGQTPSPSLGFRV
jgi:hypothetical protein